MNAVERFMKYVTFETTSDENCPDCPSTPGQLVLADFLVEELKGAGVADAYHDGQGYVYGHIPAAPGCEATDTIGLIAHMDTSPDVSGKGVQPIRVVYDGRNIELLDPSFIVEEMIVSAGQTLLGADDKAGVAEIVAACEALTTDPSIQHGPISICFTPDEEIGRGADRFDLEAFGADYAYTVDGGELGEIEDETFNAASARLTVHGLNTHPGTAKGRMRNALLYLHEWVALLPPEQTPERTEGREGFYHVHEASGDVSEATLSLLVRDHDRAAFEQRKAYLQDITVLLNRKYGEGTFVLELSDSYYNMKEIIDQHPQVVARAEAAMAACGVTPIRHPIRGGTDGARLSFMGLPCPNLSTGGYNFHSKHESIPVRSMLKMTEVLVKLVTAE